MPASPELIERIKSIFTKEDLAPKTLLVKEGARAKKIFYIEQGCCRAWFNNDGKDVTFQFIFEHHFASSFETIMSNTTSWYSVETLERTLAYSISIDEFRQKMKLYPNVKNFYYQYVENRLLF